jgi:hypothetical protein
MMCYRLYRVSKGGTCRKELDTSQDIEYLKTHPLLETKNESVGWVSTRQNYLYGSAPSLPRGVYYEIWSTK